MKIYAKCSDSESELKKKFIFFYKHLLKIFFFKSIILSFHVDGKTFKKPRRPYEKERLDAELKLVGEYGLRCKRELWRVQYALSRIRNNARMLLTLDEKNPRRIFEGEALLRRMNRYGLLDESQNKLDYVLALTVENFLERRLQTLVFKSGMAKSIHHARVLIRQKHIRYGIWALLVLFPLQSVNNEDCRISMAIAIFI